MKSHSIMKHLTIISKNRSVSGLVRNYLFRLDFRIQWWWWNGNNDRNGQKQEKLKKKRKNENGWNCRVSCGVAGIAYGWTSVKVLLQFGCTMCMEANCIILHSNLVIQCSYIEHSRAQPEDEAEAKRWTESGPRCMRLQKSFAHTTNV